MGANGSLLQSNLFLDDCLLSAMPLLCLAVAADNGRLSMHQLVLGDASCTDISQSRATDWLLKVGGGSGGQFAGVDLVPRPCSLLGSAKCPLPLPPGRPYPGRTGGRAGIRGVAGVSCRSCTLFWARCHAGRLLGHLGDPMDQGGSTVRREGFRPGILDCTRQLHALRPCYAPAARLWSPPVPCCALSAAGANEWGHPWLCVALGPPRWLCNRWAPSALQVYSCGRHRRGGGHATWRALAHCQLDLSMHRRERRRRTCAAGAAPRSTVQLSRCPAR